nr:immunoglobulin heavy chain junction region [Macaca mulatta]
CARSDISSATFYYGFDSW